MAYHLLLSQKCVSIYFNIRCYFRGEMMSTDTAMEIADLEREIERLGHNAGYWQTCLLYTSDAADE